MNPDSAQLLTDLLRQVSRSFYTTLRVLPSSVRAPIGLAYLLARATDTIADTELVSVESRVQALRALRERILGERCARVDFGELQRHQGEPAEKVLLERVEEAIGLLGSFSPNDQALIRAVLDTITGGQQLDLERFGGAGAGRIAALSKDAELDDYTYRVAGCVGEFWTKICRAHVFPNARLDDAALLRDGVRFGKGLQLVNILRDLPRDLRGGRCYLPAERLKASDLMPAELLDATKEERLRPLYNEYLDLAQEHLAAGWDYTNRLPWSCVRVRLACAWPILIGVRTLSRLRHEKILDGSRRIKVTRAEVRNLMLKSLLLYPFPGAWRGQFQAA